MAQGHDMLVHDDPSHDRYEIYVAGTLAGFAVYRRASDRIVFVHTEVEPEWEGHGVGSALAEFALEDVRRQGLHMTPQCPFVAAYVRRNREYVELIDPAHRAAFEARTDG